MAVPPKFELPSEGSPNGEKSRSPKQVQEMRRQAKTEETSDLARFTDGELVASCLSGESSAWEALIHRYQRLIYSIPIKKGFSAVDAADVFQSVCVLLLEKLSTLRKHDKIASWLMTTTTRECWRVAAQWRREGPAETRDPDDHRDKLSEMADSKPLAEEESVLLERQQILRQAIDGLPDRCRRLISMLFYDKDDPSYADIARSLKIPVASVGPTRARCLEKLKKELEGKL